MGPPVSFWRRCAFCRSGFYLPGKMYRDGPGLPAAIAKGAEYLQKAGGGPDAKEGQRHRKKAFFGKWVR